MNNNHVIYGFRQVPLTGVVYVMSKAMEYGYEPGDIAWINLGQGSPETGSLSDSKDSSRITTIQFNDCDNGYSPMGGRPQLRKQVAEFYNFIHRKNKKSKYTWENVCITGGGRIALTRIAAALGNINMGHFLPDYTAYEELLSIFKSIVPIPILLDPELDYHYPLHKLENEINGKGLKAILISNPCNPTGRVIKGDELDSWVQLSKQYNCSLILDEYYSHFIYAGDEEEPHNLISGAKYIEDVNNYPIIIVDGLTKNWRYPGWRIGWVLGPKEVIQSILSAGSFLDGGANNPLQKAAEKLLDPQQVLNEAAVLQKIFRQKRDYCCDRLKKIGLKFNAPPQGTFYIWADLSDLPASINDGMKFFEAGLIEKVITVPGVFFDVNPEKRREHARFNQYIRISFGPEMHKLKVGLDAIDRLVSARM